MRRAAETNHVDSHDLRSSLMCVLSLALKLAGQNETFAVSYATEASLFHQVGALSVVCGPGDIAQAHTANEWIELAELEKCLGFLGRVGEWAES